MWLLILLLGKRKNKGQTAIGGTVNIGFILKVSGRVGGDLKCSRLED